MELRGIIPAIWQVEPWHPAEICIIVDWLQTEIEQHAEQRLPVLAELAGWRNREVHEFCAVGGLGYAVRSDCNSGSLSEHAGLRRRLASHIISAGTP